MYEGPDRAVATNNCEPDPPIQEVSASDAADRAAPRDIINALHARGYTRLSSDLVATILGDCQLEDWLAFKASWNDLAIDEWMGDGGRYRRRSYAVFAVGRGAIARQAHRAHFQDLRHNPLNGGIERWFAPTTAAVTDSPILHALLRAVTGIVEWGSGPRSWHVEMHQFRITASAEEVGCPTPEGLHQDGVDWVFMMAVERSGVSGGETEIQSIDGERTDRFTMARPLDAVCVNDKRVRHGATPIACLPDRSVGYRDVLVITWAEAHRRAPVIRTRN